MLLEVVMKIVECSPWDDIFMDGIKFVHILCLTKKILYLTFIVAPQTTHAPTALTVTHSALAVETPAAL